MLRVFLCALFSILIGSLVQAIGEAWQTSYLSVTSSEQALLTAGCKSAATWALLSLAEKRCEKVLETREVV